MHFSGFVVSLLSWTLSYLFSSVSMSISLITLLYILNVFLEIWNLTDHISPLRFAWYILITVIDSVAAILIMDYGISLKEANNGHALLNMKLPIKIKGLWGLFLILLILPCWLFLKIAPMTVLGAIATAWVLLVILVLMVYFFYSKHIDCVMRDQAILDGNIVTHQTWNNICFYMFVGMTVVCLSQFFLYWTMLNPYEDIWTQILSSGILLVFSFINMFYMKNPKK